MRLREEDSYKEVTQRRKWRAISDRRAENQKETLCEEEGVLSRCLEGSFPDDDEIPSRNEVRRWVIQTWKDIHNVNIYDMNGISFFSSSNQEMKQSILLWGSGEERIIIYRWNGGLPKQERRKLTSSLIGFGFGF